MNEQKFENNKKNKYLFNQINGKNKTNDYRILSDKNYYENSDAIKYFSEFSEEIFKNVKDTRHNKK